MSESAGEQPRTVWEHCLVWASLLISVRARHGGTGRSLSPEEQATWEGEDQPLTAVLLAAALHHQAAEQDLLDGAPEAAAALWLHTPGPPPAGVETVLRYRPYETLLAAPEVPGRGDGERARLLGAAYDPGTRRAHPDGLLLWQRIRAAALTVVEGVVGVGRGSSITLHDVAAGEADRAAQGRLAELWGPED
ncbi:hypothetical protein DVA86_20400 [Streptomyces armeniacus]|uniref:Uncharacterized protein n=1 Tax=Streptomyces armeniacus TaxID=83291 RepID=A0A345XSP1_9ACTN|nr:hypothetical protein [Streptomyces armeniacus]AXK34657.1 hypothetical protein DVA86_20400 [Streptomyces armeniacus]